MSRILSFLIFIKLVLMPCPGHAQVRDSISSQQLNSTAIHNLANGDSLVIFESRICEYPAGTVVANGNTVMYKLLFPQSNPKLYSRTSKYVLRNENGNFKLQCYVSDRDRYPNYKFDRVMKKEGYWHFKKYFEKTLSAGEVQQLCLFEAECNAHPIDKYDEGDNSKNMTVIRHGKKTLVSSYREAKRDDAIVSGK